ncbi:hypothetical protein GHT09_018790 [Marmota monax]|uniref:Major facilitator superfamily (MFS) profile domain-containing protein n=1 Tax=Marmota monax TaxID=9995 RepID=A0A834PIZ4_MARMO|nr:hypothetical protein GHT09_018790 [Marmota monax]
MKREWAARCAQSAERGAAAGPTGRINPVTGFPRSHLACDCLRDLLKPSPWGRMPQHVTVDKGFLSMPQLLFPSMPSATDPTLPGVTPGSLCSAHSPLDSCGQLLCEPRAEKHSSLGPREVRYVSISEGPQDTACGWRAFAPRCLQVFNTPKGLLFFLCVASFLQGMTVNGFINTVITSIERRFDLHSYQSGLIASSYDIAACLCLTFVSYFGGNGHKPRWLGWGVLVLGSGSLVFALPHFTAGRYEVEVDEGARTCPANQSVLCADSTSGLSRYRLVFMLGQFLHGMGATPLYTLGVTYLDENVKSSYSPVYIAIFYTAAILGPAAGYLVGGAMLNVYTELGQRTELTTESPQWVGAWWIGFLGAGAAAFLIAIPILGYPRRLPGGFTPLPPRPLPSPSPSDCWGARGGLRVLDPTFLLGGGIPCCRLGRLVSRSCGLLPWPPPTAPGHAAACPAQGRPLVLPLAPGSPRWHWGSGGLSALRGVAAKVSEEVPPDLGWSSSKGRPAEPVPSGSCGHLLTLPPGSKRYVAMRAAEAQQRERGHEAASNPARGRTIRDLPL